MKPAPSKSAQAGDARPCPICDKPQTAAFRPFCSARCKQVDLSRWLSGAYAIPAAEQDGEPDLPEPSDRGVDH